MKRKLILLAFALTALGAGVPLLARAASQSSLEGKLALENSLEKRVRMVLSEALGTEDIIVIISAELQEQEKRSAEIMPGIPEKDRMGESSLSSTLTMVKKLSASLILDKSVSDEDTKLARKLAAGLLGLPPEREDLISVEKMNFRKTRPLTFADLFLPPNLWSLVWIVVVGLLAAFTISSFLAPISRSAKAFVEAFNSKAAGASAPGDQDYRPAQREKTEESKTTENPRAELAAEGHKPPFWFLNSSQVQSLAFIMRYRPIEDLTIVLSYAPPEAASKLAEALYPRSVEALSALPKATLMAETRVKALEAELLSALDYVVGGEDKTINIISGLDEAVQEKALLAFSKLDPAMSRKLNSSIVKLSDLDALEPAQAQTLARRLPMRVIAAAIEGSPYAEAFVSKLAGGMQERMRQEMDLTRPLSTGAYKAERAKLIEALRQMIKEGFIAPGQNAASRPLAAAPKPQPVARGAKTGPAAEPAPAPTKPAPAAAPKP